MWLKRVVGATVVGCSVVLAAPPAMAKPTARLQYTQGAGAEQCPGEDAGRASGAARLGCDPFVDAADTTAVAIGKREQGEWRGEVKLVDKRGSGRGMRQLSSSAADCADLIAAMALTISIAIDPLSISRPAPPPPAPSGS